MTLEQSITELCKEATVNALHDNLPELLARLTLPPDANTRHSLKEAAARLKLPEATLRQRVREGEIEAVRDGKYTFILEGELMRYNNRLLDRERFRRDQRAKSDPAVSDEITAMLEPKAKP